MPSSTRGATTARPARPRKEAGGDVTPAADTRVGDATRPAAGYLCSRGRWTTPFGLGHWGSMSSSKLSTCGWACVGMKGYGVLRGGCTL